MDKFFFAIIMITAGLVVASGYIIQADMPDSEELVIYIANMSSDKPVYHSSELMNLSITVYSNSELENVTVSAGGINGRFNQAATIDLKKGNNDISFAYSLPRCNVCGGISAGEYGLSCNVSYKNITVEDSTTINIQQ